MIKKTIKYEDYEGNERKEDFYFNLNEAELTELAMSRSGGLEQYARRIIAAQSEPELIALFKELILISYGEKSDDGKRFVKVKDGHKLSEDFSQTEAYSSLFMELATDANAAATFFNGLIPAKLRDKVADYQKEQSLN